MFGVFHLEKMFFAQKLLHLEIGGQTEDADEVCPDKCVRSKCVSEKQISVHC